MYRGALDFLYKIKNKLAEIYHNAKGEDIAKEYTSFHIGLISDKNRTENLKRAIFEIVKPGDIVADIGTGSGILALFACQAKAKRVYAIEKSPFITVAKRLAKQNGFADKIIFINKDSKLVKLPEKVDGIISETIGSVGLEENILAILLDARKRFLKREGFFIPKGLLFYLVPVYLKECDDTDIINIFDKKKWELDFTPLIENNNNVLYFLMPQLKNFVFLGEPQEAGFVEFIQLNSEVFETTCQLPISRSGELSGFISYFHIQLSDKVWLCPEKMGNQICWSSWCTFLFFPATKSVHVEAGDTLKTTFSYSKKGRWCIIHTKK